MLHTCDNPPCINPSHLFPGSYGDNMRDAIRKGRHVRRVLRGENHPQVKLTIEQALEAKNCPRIFGAASALARKLGVVPHTIFDIRDGKIWKQLQGKEGE